MTPEQLRPLGKSIRETDPTRWAYCIARHCGQPLSIHRFRCNCGKHQYQTYAEYAATVAEWEVGLRG